MQTVEESPSVLVSLACNLDTNILSAAFPLLEEGRVEAIEWSFDTLFKVGAMPPWFAELLAAYSRERRLIGHGVYFSLLSGGWTPEQQQWLEHLRELSARFRFDHVTEHFGFFTGQNFHSGAPLPVPYSPTTLRLGQDRLSRLAQACCCPVGLENLTSAYGLEEVKQHGEFLDKLLEPVNGFIILDLHNLYCQLHNFSVSYEALMSLYPLHRVREIHISGGSWEDSVLVPNQRIRRDTHDDAVPEEVFALLERAMPQCPQLKYVVLEQLGTGLATTASQAQFRQDFARMEALVLKHRTSQSVAEAEAFMPLHPLVPGPVVTDEKLSEQQRLLSQVLETAPSVAAAQLQLNASPLAHSDWRVEKWAPHMLETAISIAQKWKK